MADPRRFTTDEVAGISVKSILLVVGAPLNIHSCYVAIRAMREKKQLAKFGFIKLNLSLSDLCTLFFYTVTAIAWTATEFWKGGDALCKGVQFAQTFSFYLTSNIMGAIALERVLAMYSIKSAFHNKMRRAKLLILAAYILAGLSSFPQLLIWAEVSFNLGNDYQCTTLWKRDAFHACLQEFDYEVRQILSMTGNISRNLSIDIQSFGEQFLERCMERPVSGLEYGYGLAHLAVIFYLPASLIVACNGILIVKLSERTKRSIRWLGTHNHIHVHTHRHWSILAKSETLKKTLLLSITYICCWLPYSATAVVDVIFDTRIYHFFYKDFCSDLMVINALINPFVYRIPVNVDQGRRTRNDIIGSTRV